MAGGQKFFALDLLSCFPGGRSPAWILGLSLEFLGLSLTCLAIVSYVAFLLVCNNEVKPAAEPLPSMPVYKRLESTSGKNLMLNSATHAKASMDCKLMDHWAGFEAQASQSTNFFSRLPLT